MPPVLDVFSSDAFSLMEMTKAINRMDYNLGRIGEMNLFEAVPVATTSVMIEERNSVLQLVQSSQRGNAPRTRSEERRTARTFAIPHLELSDTVYADSVQNVRAFGQTELETCQAVIARKEKQLRRDIEATLENLRLGAIKGIVADADGTTLYNLFDEFEVTQLDEVDFALTTETTDIRKICQAIRRSMAKEMGALSQQRFKIHAFCSDEFFDALIAHPNVMAAYDRWQIGAALREDYTWEQFEYAGIVFENYRGSDDGTSITIAANKAHLFPVVNGLYECFFAPADYAETCNSLGLPLYAKSYRDDKLDKYLGINVQSNPLPLCLRPRCLMKGTKASE